MATTEETAKKVAARDELQGEILLALANLVGLDPRDAQGDQWDFEQAVAWQFWNRLEPKIRPSIRHELRTELEAYRGALSERLDQQIAEQLAADAGVKAVEQARDVIVQRLCQERKLWREYDRNQPPKRRWWQRRERKTSTAGMSGIG